MADGGMRAAERDGSGARVGACPRDHGGSTNREPLPLRDVRGLPARPAAHIPPSFTYVAP
jgi:hypothetical protein